MQVFLAALARALIGALPSLISAFYKKILVPIIDLINRKILSKNRKDKNMEKAKELKDADEKDDIGDNASNMP